MNTTFKILLLFVMDERALHPKINKARTFENAWDSANIVKRI